MARGIPPRVWGGKVSRVKDNRESYGKRADRVVIDSKWRNSEIQVTVMNITVYGTFEFIEYLDENGKLETNVPIEVFIGRFPQLVSIPTRDKPARKPEVKEQSAAERRTDAARKFNLWV